MIPNQDPNESRIHTLRIPLTQTEHSHRPVLFIIISPMHPFSPLWMYGVSLLLLFIGTVVRNRDGFLGGLSSPILTCSTRAVSDTIVPNPEYTPSR